MARIDYGTEAIVGGGGQTESVDSLFERGLMYSVGRDVEQDLVEAHKYFNLAAVGGKREARQYCAELAVEMSKADVARAQRLAREWLTAH